ncbi:retrotransposon protein, putative, ty1-copia subclass [Tanacetum coccineum]
MENSKRGNIPMQDKLRLSKSQGASTPAELKRMQNVPYALAVGSIMVSCYTDVGYLTDADDLKSQTGYVFVLNGGVVDWKSAKQSIFATSSAEAEYIAAFMASMDDSINPSSSWISSIYILSIAAERLFKDEATEEKGERARMASFVGAMAIADLVKTTLGPKGMTSQKFKMMMWARGCCCQGESKENILDQRLSYPTDRRIERKCCVFVYLTALLYAEEFIEDAYNVHLFSIHLMPKYFSNELFKWLAKASRTKLSSGFQTDTTAQNSNQVSYVDSFGLIADEIFISNKLQKGDIVQLTKFQLMKPFYNMGAILCKSGIVGFDLTVIHSKCDINCDPKRYPLNVPDEDHANSHHVEEPSTSKQKQDHVDSFLNEDIDDSR